MNYEENRLQTFHSWPANAVVEPQRIAKAGFFYTGENLIVECFCCGGRISEWDYGDQVMAKHRILNPQCPFVKKPTEAGNVPVLNKSLSKVSYRSGTSQDSDSLQSNSPISLSANSLEGSSPISNLSSNEFGSESLVQPQEPVGNRNDVQSPRMPGVTCRAHEADSLIRPSCNIEDIGPQEGIPDIHDEVDNRLRYRSEAARLETFRTWPKSHIVPPGQLAKSGFYYLQEEDKVKCAFCSGVVGHWEAGDDPDQEHRRHFPSCPLHYNVPVGNIPIDTHISGEQQYGFTSSNVVMRELPPPSTPERDERRAVVEHSKSLPERTDVLVEGIHQHRGPRHPEYSTVESRLRTFKDWPGGLRQTPQQLAQAGFYYTGVHDQVRCFHCDGGLRQWDDSDDPWVEHARWFPKCIYILLMKGEEFIQEVATQYPPVLPANDSHGKDSKHTTTKYPTYRVRNVSEEELDSLMNTIPAQMAVGVGLDVSKIRRALRRKMEETGLPYSTSDALIGAVLDMSTNSSSSHSPESPTPGPSQEHTGENDGSNLQQDIPESNDNRENDAGNLQKEDQYKSSRNLAVSQSLPSLPHIACDEQAVYTVSRAGVVPLPNINKENSEGSSSAALLAEENRRLKEARLCKICMDEEVGVVFLPCGHLVTCVNCTPSLQDCPLCRQPIKATVRTFLS